MFLHYYSLSYQDYLLKERAYLPQDTIDNYFLERNSENKKSSIKQIYFTVPETANTSFTLSSAYFVSNSGSTIAEFRKTTSGTLAANKAYLKLSQGSTSRLQIVFDDSETNSIGNASYLKAESEVRDNKVYDLSGRKVAELPTGSVSSTLPKGMYIVNGKKIIVK